MKFKEEIDWNLFLTVSNLTDEELNKFVCVAGRRGSVYTDINRAKISYYTTLVRVLSNKYMCSIPQEVVLDFVAKNIAESGSSIFFTDLYKNKEVL